MTVRDLIAKLQQFDGGLEVDISRPDVSVDPEGSGDNAVHVECRNGVVSIWKNVYHLD